MFHSSKIRWTIAGVIAACVMGLALLGGTWQVSNAQTTTGDTIPNIDSLSPTWVKVYQSAVSVTINGWQYITGYPVKYTKILFKEIGSTNPPIELTPVTSLDNKLVSPLLPATIMAHPGIWDVQVVNHHEAPQPDEFGNKMRFTVSTGFYYMPLVTK